MKQTIILLLSVFLIQNAKSQVTINQLVNKDETAIFNSDAYNNIITRQNSCSFYINDFIFSVTKTDKYFVDLQINLNSYNIGSTTPDKVKTIRSLFCIKNNKSKHLFTAFWNPFEILFPIWLKSISCSWEFVLILFFYIKNLINAVINFSCKDLIIIKKCY